MEEDPSPCGVVASPLSPIKESTPPSCVVGGGGSEGGGIDGDSSDAHDPKVNYMNLTPLLLFSFKNCRNGGRRQEQGKRSAWGEGTIYVVANREASHTHAESALIRAPQAHRR